MYFLSSSTIRYERQYIYIIKQIAPPTKGNINHDMFNRLLLIDKHEIQGYLKIIAVMFLYHIHNDVKDTQMIAALRMFMYAPNTLDEVVL